MRWALGSWNRLQADNRVTPHKSTNAVALPTTRRRRTVIDRRPAERLLWIYARSATSSATLAATKLGRAGLEVRANPDQRHEQIEADRGEDAGLGDLQVRHWRLDRAIQAPAAEPRRHRRQKEADLVRATE